LPQHGYPYVLALSEIELQGGTRARVLKLDPRLVTVDEKLALGGGEGASPVVVAVPPVIDVSESSLWFSESAFHVGTAAHAPRSLRLASGRQSGPRVMGSAAIAVQADEGMLVYVEVVRVAGAMPIIAAAALREPLERLGCGDAIVLDKPWAIALGGDGDLAGKPMRAHESSVRLMRKQGAGARSIFDATPIVPIAHWFPLQAKRVRYFKKRKKKEDP
jgi:hypothetical protein